LKFLALPVPEILIAIEVLGGVANPQSLGRESVGEFIGVP